MAKKKRIGLLVLMILVIFLLGGGGFWWMSKAGLIFQISSPNISSPQITPTFTFNTKPYYKEKLPPVKSKEDLEKIRKLDFLECKIVLTSSDLKGCISRILQESIRVEMVRDPRLVPELIKIAKQKRFKSPSYIFKTEAEKLLYRQQICQLRYSAVKALGEIKDPRAVDVLLSLMREDYKPSTSCFFTWPSEEGYISMCEKAGEALIKINPEKIVYRLISDLEKTWTAYKKAFKILMPWASDTYSPLTSFPSLSLSLIKMNSLLYDFTKPSCYLNTIAQLEKGREYIFNELKKKDLEKEKFFVFMGALSNYQLTREELEIVKYYFSPQNKDIPVELKISAALSIVKNPSPENLDFYIYLINNSYDAGFYALRKLKLPEALPILTRYLESNDYFKSSMAAEVLYEYEAQYIKSLIPILIEKAKTEGDEAYFKALAKANEPSIIDDLINIIYTSKSSTIRSNALKTIGLIFSSESKRALKNLLSDTKNLDESLRTEALFWYLFQTKQTDTKSISNYFSADVLQRELQKALSKRNKYEDKKSKDSNYFGW